MKPKKSITPKLYFPCGYCGRWRREHIKLPDGERKCPFDATTFRALNPMDFTPEEISRTLNRLRILDKQLVDHPRTILDALEYSVGDAMAAASEYCKHVRQKWV